MVVIYVKYVVILQQLFIFHCILIIHIQT